MSYENQKVSIPTNVIQGFLDPVIIKQYLIGIGDYYDEVEVTHLNGGHFKVDEQPALVGRAIKEFLRKD